MIRIAEEKDFLRPIKDIATLRILSLHEAYGDVPFVRYYADDEGSLLCLMDGVCFFSPAVTLTEEWQLFLNMNPDIRHIGCSGVVGEAIAACGGWCLAKKAPVMQYQRTSRPAGAPSLCRTPSLPGVYALLQQCFTEISPFEAWYPDVSHRVRHGCCMLSCAQDNDRIVSTAMTVAQADGHALLGQVATHPDYRCRGLAAACLNDLISRWQGDHLYIVPATEAAEKLYKKLGFCPGDTWAELIRI
ncbi:MAG: GNAT family N-acetyltransferase [Clostridia bacterium]|nr:GNAT family N-acetyltransferase [Clostridia bacterium]